jgi:hypothetical protein
MHLRFAPFRHLKWVSGNGFRSALGREALFATDAIVLHVAGVESFQKLGNALLSSDSE